MDALGCLLCVYLYGGIGFQSGFEITENLSYSSTGHTGNSYELGIGEFGLVVNHGIAYVEFKHISGINTPEQDLGLNAIVVGAHITYKGLSSKIGFGPQSQFDHKKSNEYGSLILEASIMYDFDGLFLKASKLDDMEYLTAGWIKKW